MGLTTAIVVAGLSAAAATTTSAILSSRSQRQANATNAQSVADTNATNAANVAATNEANQEMMREQNDWNREQWQLENEYNSPSAQMQRYIEAGINPMWAMTGPPSNTAYQLTSASPAPMQAAEAIPAQIRGVDYGQFGDIFNGAMSVANAFQALGLNERGMNVKEALGLSEAQKNEVEALLKRKQAEGQDLQNKWSAETFSLRCQAEADKLRNMYADYEKLKAEGKNAEAMLDNIRAEEELVRVKISATGEEIAQRWKQLEIDQQNANTSFGMLKARISEIELQNRQFDAQLTKWDNDALMQYMYKFGKQELQRNKASMNAGVGVSGFGFGGDYSGEESTQQLVPATMDDMIRQGIRLMSVGSEVIERARNNPTPSNLEDASKAADVMTGVFNDLSSKIGSSVKSNKVSDDTSVVNPSGISSFGTRQPIQ